MKVHPLKLVSLISIFGLILSQLGLLLWLSDDFKLMLVPLLSLPLLLPLKGLLTDRRYTYKWIGFLTLFYMGIGISESFSNPELRSYSLLTIFFSTALFISSVYYSRYLRQNASV
jgi:uncharacterized membrane protein